MKQMLTAILILSAGLSASAAFTNDAILGPNDTFACDSFASNTKVACMPNTQSNYNQRASFPSGPAIIIAPYQVINCRDISGSRDIICNAGIMPGGPIGPGPGQPGQFQPPPPPPRFAFGYPDYNCLNSLPSVNNADDMASNGIVPATNRVADRCEQNRDLREVRDLQNKGYQCTVDTLASNNQGNLACAQSLASKVINQGTLKGSHRARFEREYCATKTYKCVRPF